MNVDHGFSRDYQKLKKNQMCINWQRHELPLTQQQKQQIADDLLKEVGSKPTPWTVPFVQHSGERWWQGLQGQRLRWWLLGSEWEGVNYTET